MTWCPGTHTCGVEATVCYMHVAWQITGLVTTLSLSWWIMSSLLGTS